jgi:hypothetical protein
MERWDFRWSSWFLVLESLLQVRVCGLVCSKQGVHDRRRRSHSRSLFKLQLVIAWSLPTFMLKHAQRPEQRMKEA